jgi:hypothetical protein
LSHRLLFWYTCVEAYWLISWRFSVNFASLFIKLKPQIPSEPVTFQRPNLQSKRSGATFNRPTLPFRIVPWTYSPTDDRLYLLIV